VTDPEILKKERRGARQMCQPCRHLSQVHTMNYARFIRGKSDLQRKKMAKANRQEGDLPTCSPPPPMNGA